MNGDIMAVQAIDGELCRWIVTVLVGYVFTGIVCAVAAIGCACASAVGDCPEHNSDLMD